MQQIVIIVIIIIIIIIITITDVSQEKKAEKTFTVADLSHALRHTIIILISNSQKMEK